MAESMANLNKGDELINRPNLWAVGTEIDFGGGLYGVRLQGTLSARTRTGIWNFGSTPKIINYGGCIKKSNLVMFGLADYYVDTPAQYGFGFQVNLNPSDASASVGDLDLFAGSNTYSNNSAYDIWFLYTKS